MSDSDISKILLRNTYPQNVHSERSNESSFSPAKIISLPEHVRHHKEDKLSGNVIRHEKEKDLVVIRTPKGDNIVIQTEKNFPVQEGDIVEIKIPSSQKNQNLAGYVRIQQSIKDELPAPYLPIDQISTSGFSHRTIPQIQTLSNTEIIPLSASQLKNIQPILPKIISQISLPLLHNPDFFALQNIPSQSLMLEFSELTHSPPNYIIGNHFETSLFSENNSPIDFFSLQALPMKSIIAKLIKTSPEHLLFSSPNEPQDHFSFHMFQNGVLTSINDEYPTQKISLNDDFVDVPHYAKAGEIELRLIGQTSEIGFPVLQKLSSPDKEKTIVAFNGIAHQAKENSVFVITPSFEQIPHTTLVTIPPLSPPSLFIPQEIWASFDEVLQTLQSHAPLQAQTLSALVPNSSSPLRAAHGALFFLAALRSGDLQSWMGEKAIDTLKRAGKSELLQRLFKEVSDVSKSNDTPSEWKSAALPYLHDHHIYRLNLHSKKEYPNQEQPDKKGGTTRFIIELSLSKIGNVQLDGLFQGNVQQTVGRLDLIVRTQNPFSKASQMEMRKLYSEAIHETNFTGELAFQSDPEQWVKISAPQILDSFSKNI